MICDPSDQAFARPCGESENFESEGRLGLTKREYFAAKAMQGQYANSRTLDNPDGVAAWAVEIADALIAALNVQGDDDETEEENDK